MDDIQRGDLEIEQSVLKYAAFRDPSILVEVDQSYFHGHAERIVFNALRTVGAVLPESTLRKTVLQRVGPGHAELIDPFFDDLKDAPDLKKLESAKAAIETLYVFRVRRQLVDLSDSIYDSVSQHNEEAALNAIKAALVSSTKTIQIGDYVRDYELRQRILEERGREKIKSDLIPTGINPFDRVTGGLMKGEVGVVLAGSGTGKSLIKLNFAAHAWLKGYNVIFVGLEMTKEENEFRLDSILTKIPARNYRLSTLDKEDLEIWDTTITALKKRKNYFVPVTGKKLTMQEIFAVVDAIEDRRGEKTDLLIVDHIALVQRPASSWRGQQQREVIWENMEDLVDFAKTRHIGAWSSSQVTDQGLDRKGGLKLHDTKYGRGIAENAQLVMAFYQSAVAEISNEIICKPVKGRNIEGVNKEIILIPDFTNMLLDTTSDLAAVQFTSGKRKKKVASKKTVKKKRRGMSL